MHLERSFVNWGLFLVAVGTVPLAVRAGLIPADLRWWELWPLLLVAWGVGLILGRTGGAFLGGVLVAVTLGLIVGGVLTAGSVFGGFTGSCAGSGTAFPTQNGTFSLAQAEVRLEPGCGTLDVATGPGGWQVAGSSPDGGVPEIQALPGGLTVTAPDRGFDPFASGGTHWQVTLPSGPAIDLSVTANAGRANLELANANVTNASMTVNAGSVVADLSGPRLTSISVTANAGSAKIALPAANVTGNLTANAGSVALCVPAGTGVRIRDSDAVLGSNNFDSRGLVHAGDTWTSQGFDSAPTRIDISATANVGSVELDPEGGCR
ncbi:MAG TPA: hypothetical protein VGK63_09015 [Candidatus Limnocylindrales bacterium]